LPVFIKEKIPLGRASRPKGGYKKMKYLSEYYKAIPPTRDLWTRSMQNFLAEEKLKSTPKGVLSEVPLSEGFSKLYKFELIQKDSWYSDYLAHPEGKNPSKVRLCNKWLVRFFGEVPKQFFAGIY
jgi:hypothetical protein